MRGPGLNRNLEIIERALTFTLSETGALGVWAEDDRNWLLFDQSHAGCWRNTRQVGGQEWMEVGDQGGGHCNDPGLSDTYIFQLCIMKITRRRANLTFTVNICLPRMLIIFWKTSPWDLLSLGGLWNISGKLPQTSGYLDPEPELQPSSAPSHQTPKPIFSKRIIYYGHSASQLVSNIYWVINPINYEQSETSSEKCTEKYKGLQENHGYRQWKT